MNARVMTNLLFLAIPSLAAGEGFLAQLDAAVEAGKAGDHRSAAERCRHLALSHRDHPHAADAHFSAIVFAGLLLEHEPDDTQKETRAFYTELLTEHPAAWPDSKHKNRTAWWLAELEMTQGGWESVADALPRVSLENPHHAEAIRLAVEAFDRAFANTNRPAEFARLHKAARAALQPVVIGPDKRWPQEWSPEQIGVAEHLAEWHLRHHPDSHKYAEKLLSAVDDLSGLPGSCRLSRRGVLLLSAARQQLGMQPPTATGLVRGDALPIESADTLPSDLQVYLKTLRYEQLDDADLAKRIATEIDTLTGLLLTGRLTQSFGLNHAERELALLKHQVRAKRFLGHNPSTTLPGCDRWIELAPDDPEAYETRARMLSTAKGQNYLGRAAEAWKQVEDRSTPGGERWRRARRGRIEVLRRSGKTEQAEKLAELTRLLYPSVQLGTGSDTPGP